MPEPAQGEEREDQGDQVCWLARVCDACGGLDDGPPSAVCSRCGALRTGDDGIPDR